MSNMLCVKLKGVGYKKEVRGASRDNGGC